MTSWRNLVLLQNELQQEENLWFHPRSEGEGLTRYGLWKSFTYESIWIQCLQVYRDLHKPTEIITDQTSSYRQFGEQFIRTQKYDPGRTELEERAIQVTNDYSHGRDHYDDRFIRAW